MTIDFEGLGILRRQDLERGIGFQRLVQIPQIAVDLGDQRVIDQARADGARHVDGRRARRNTLDTSVRKGDLKITHRYLSGYQTNPSGPVDGVLSGCRRYPVQPNEPKPVRSPSCFKHQSKNRTPYSGCKVEKGGKRLSIRGLERAARRD